MPIPCPWPRRAGGLAVLTLAATACATAPRAANPVPDDTLPALGPGWHRIAGPAGTGCAGDTPFAFFVRPGDPRWVAVIFAGGGACWDGRGCDLQGRPSFDPRVDTTDAPETLGGVFDFTNAANPLRDFTMVMVPSCTGDVHLGARTVTYTTAPDTTTPAAAGAPTRTFRIRHLGAINAAAALDWTVRHVPAPELVFVTGGSAGAMPSPVYALQAARRYPRARIVQLGDGGGGYRAPTVPGLLASWGATTRLRQDAAFRGVDSAALTFEALYFAAVRAAPRVQYAQVNSVEDRSQLRWLAGLGVPAPRLAPLLAANLADIQRADPQFRSYTAPGQTHVLLIRPEFYTVTVDGVAFPSWLSDLLAGRGPDDVGQLLLVSRSQ